MARTKGAKNKVKKTGKKTKAKKVVAKPKKKAVKKTVKKKVKAKAPGRKKKRSASDLSTFMIVDAKGNAFRDNDTFIYQPNVISTELEFATKAEAKAALKQMRTDHTMGILPDSIGDSLKSAEVKPKKELYVTTYSITDMGNVSSEVLPLPLPANTKAQTLKEAVKLHTDHIKVGINVLKKTIIGAHKQIAKEESNLKKFQRNMKAYKG